MADLTRTSPAENLDLLAARLSDHLSPAEKDELREAATLLRSPAVPEGCVVPSRWLPSSHTESNTEGDIYTAGIDEGSAWGHRIQCHGRSVQEAEKLRDQVLQALSTAPPAAAGWVSVKDNHVPEPDGALVWVTGVGSKGRFYGDAKIVSGQPFLFDAQADIHCHETRIDSYQRIVPPGEEGR